MAEAVKPSKLFETDSLSGIVYLALDHQLVYSHRFQQHIKINILYDQGQSDLTSDNNAQSSGLFTEEHLHLYTAQQDDLASSNHMQKVSVMDATANSSGFYSEDDLENQTPETQKHKNILVTTNCASDLVSEELENCGLGAVFCGPLISNAARVQLSGLEVIDNRNDSDNFREKESEGSLTSLNIIRKSDKKISLKRKFKNGKKQTINMKKVRAKVIKNKVRTHKVKKESSVITRLTPLNETTKKKTLKKQVQGKSMSVNDGSRTRKLRKLELEKEVKCDYCLQTFRSQQEFFNHRKGERAFYKCKVCNKAVPFKAHLMVHMRKHNLQDFPLIDETDILNSQNMEIKTSVNKKGNKPIKCDVCDLCVSNIPVLKQHMMIHTGEYAYKCCVCGEKTHSIAKHNNHLATHLKSGKVQCKICNISFETRSDLSRHQLTHEFKCSICEKVFPNKTSRMFHYKMAHKDDILKCQVCGKLFSSEDELAPHLKYHRNRAKTQCTVCGLLVTRLDNHLLSHNQRGEDNKMFVCDQCPKQFRQKLSFQRHLRTHSEEKPYSCMECPKKFARSGGLRRHMITHTQERPFVCDICGKACSQMGNLRIHMQVHKDHSPFQCLVCGDNFSSKNSLHEHMRTTHYPASDGHTEFTPTVPQDYYN